MTTKGTLIAAMAAGFLANALPLAVHAAEGDEIKCSGVNECKGHGGCKSSANECAGKNGCKGKGWVKMAGKECKAKGGKVDKVEKAAKGK